MPNVIDLVDRDSKGRYEYIKSVSELRPLLRSIISTISEFCPYPKGVQLKKIVSLEISVASSDTSENTFFL